MSVTTVADKVCNIVSNVLQENGKTIPQSIHNARLIEHGLVDSMGIVNLVSRIEAEFDVVFSAEDFESGAFDTIGGISAAVSEHKQNG